MIEPVDIIIPTYDNPHQLHNCVQSMLAYHCEYPVRIIIVNNGKAKIDNHGDLVVVLDPGENLGWEGGLRLGLEHSKSKYVMFANDDIFIPRASSRWMKYLVREMDIWTHLGAVGPSSNVVMGKQNMLNLDFLARVGSTSFLIGFCMLVRREALDKIGGVRKVNHGGDDIDLSIRLRVGGYPLAIVTNVFVYHYGFQTGQKIYGTSDKPGGWNSRDMMENTNKELIQNHGFLEYWKTMKNQEFTNWSNDIGEYAERLNRIDSESEAIKEFVIGDKVIELGCGGKKTVKHAIGVDLTPNGKTTYLNCESSVADIIADVSKPLPFEDNSIDTIIARHVLEHCLDVVETLNNWKRVLKPDGRMIISCPDERVDDSIPINPEHLHAFIPSSLVSLGEALGLKLVGLKDDYNHMSFSVCLEKEGR